MIFILSPTPALYPSAMLLPIDDVEYCKANAPIAIVDDEDVADDPASCPMAILFDPVIIPDKALLPKATLNDPVVFAERELFPKALLLPPVVFANSALDPKALLVAPVVFADKAKRPTAILFVPVIRTVDDPKRALGPMAIFRSVADVVDVYNNELFPIAIESDEATETVLVLPFKKMLADATLPNLIFPYISRVNKLAPVDDAIEKGFSVVVPTKEKLDDGVVEPNPNAPVVDANVARIILFVFTLSTFASFVPKFASCPNELPPKTKALSD